MIIMTYYCKHCDRNQFQYVPVCQIDKEFTECKYCGRKAKLSEDFLDSLTNKTLKIKDMAEDIHEDLVDVHKTLRGMIRALKINRGENINV